MGSGEVSRSNDKNKLDRAVAKNLLVDRREVRVITQAWINQLRNLLAKNETVSIEGLGRFRVQRINPEQNPIRNLTAGTFKPGENAGTRTVEVSRHVRVHFSQSPTLKKVFNKESNMEKYGVNESVNQERLEKQAAKGCPECGSNLIKHGSVLLCPVHGSSPFEMPQESGSDGSKKNQ